MKKSRYAFQIKKWYLLYSTLYGARKHECFALVLTAIVVNAINKHPLTYFTRNLRGNLRNGKNCFSLQTSECAR